MTKLLAALAALCLASTASAHGIAVVRSQVVVPYTPVLQVQAVAVVQPVYAAVQAVSACHVQAVQVQQVYAQPVVVQQVVRQQVVHPVRQQVIVRQQRQQVIQRSVTRTRTVIR